MQFAKPRTTNSTPLALFEEIALVWRTVHFFLFGRAIGPPLGFSWRSTMTSLVVVIIILVIVIHYANPPRGSLHGHRSTCVDLKEICF